MTAAVHVGEAGALRAVEAEYPGWRVWRSDKGRYYAVRVGARWRRDDPRPITVDAKTEGGLRKVLGEVSGQTLVWGGC